MDRRWQWLAYGSLLAIFFFGLGRAASVDPEWVRFLLEDMPESTSSVTAPSAAAQGSTAALSETIDVTQASWQDLFHASTGSDPHPLGPRLDSHSVQFDAAASPLPPPSTPLTSSYAIQESTLDEKKAELEKVREEVFRVSNARIVFPSKYPNLPYRPTLSLKELEEHLIKPMISYGKRPPWLWTLDGKRYIVRWDLPQTESFKIVNGIKDEAGGRSYYSIWKEVGDRHLNAGATLERFGVLTRIKLQRFTMIGATSCSYDSIDGTSSAHRRLVSTC